MCRLTVNVMKMDSARMPVMKRCPQCGRDYDLSMSFCLDDGAELLYGPAAGDDPVTAISSVPLEASGGSRFTQEAEPKTAILRPPITGNGSDSPSSSRPVVKRFVAVPIVLTVLVISSFFGYRYFASSGTDQIDSIAVMPFVNDSANADVEYLSDGMTETLIGSLTQLPNLNVKARSSVFRYKGKETDAKTLGKELNVEAILNGRVAQRGDQLTLSVELVDAQTENAIWSQQYTRKQNDLMALQSEIARDVSNKLRAKLSGAEQNQIAKNYTTNAEAHQLYLKGRYYWNKRMEADIKRSIEFFDKAIALDPGYALAYAGLADAYQVLPNLPGVSPEDNYPKARAAAQKALEIDPNLAEPHAALGVVLHEHDWNFVEAEKSFKRSIELNPNYASAHQWYGEYLMNMGRFDEAIIETELAQQLDPLSMIINVVLGRAYFAAQRYDDAIAQYKKVIEIYPDHPATYFRLIDVYYAKEMFEQAIEERQKLGIALGVPPERVEKRAATLKDVYRKSGGRGYWQKLLEFEQEDARSRNREMSPIELARFQVRMGNNQHALDLLEKTFAGGKRDPQLVRLKSEPGWDSLRSEPRFTDLLLRIGLPL